jgi:hypothetical protein
MKFKILLAMVFLVKDKLTKLGYVFDAIDATNQRRVALKRV